MAKGRTVDRLGLGPPGKETGSQMSAICEGGTLYSISPETMQMMGSQG